MKQKTGRKLLSVLLTLAMLVGLMPGMGLTAYAAMDQNKTFKAGDTIHSGSPMEWIRFGDENNTKKQVDDCTIQSITYNETSGKWVVSILYVPWEDPLSLSYPSQTGKVFVGLKWASTSGDPVTSGYYQLTAVYEDAPTVAVTGVSLDKAAATLTVGGATETLTATVTPENATNKAVTWTSSDEGVATVTDGVVTAVAAGTATITVTATNGTADDTTDDKTATCAVTVNAATVAVTGVSLNKAAATLTVGGATETLTATVEPDNATDKTVTWTSSDTNVATVADGVVTAVAAGTATITVTSNADSSKTATCTVTVNAAATTTRTVTWTASDITGTSGNSFTKDGITITAGNIDFKHKNFMQGGTFTTTLGNFTKIEVTARYVECSGAGWSGNTSKKTWTGDASTSVPFSGDIYDEGIGKLTIVFTIEDAPAATYTVTVNAATNGTVTASPTSAAEGAEVTLTVTPNSGYELDTLTVKDADNNNVTVTDNKFTMPASNVTVSATFKAPTPTPTPAPTPAPTPTPTPTPTPSTRERDDSSDRDTTPSTPSTPSTTTETKTSETATAADGAAVTTELDASTTTKTNSDGSVTVTDKATETVKTENADGSAIETKTEKTNAETTGSKKNADGSVTDTTKVQNTETVKETATDANGSMTITETKTEQEQNTAVTTKDNADGSKTEKTETTETVKVTEKVTDGSGKVTETVTTTKTETVTDMTAAQDGTATGTSTTTTTVTDDKGNVLSTTVTEAEIKATTDASGMVTTETAATTTTTDAQGNETVEKTVTTENKAPDGSTGTVVKDESGSIVSQSTTISQKEAEAARDEGRPAQSPLTVTPVPEAVENSARSVQVNMPAVLYDKDGDGIVTVAEMPKVEIQVTYSGPGVVAKEKDASGNLTRITECYEGSVIVPVTGTGEIVIVDNTKTFNDVAGSDWYSEYVTFVTAREIFNGTGNGQFSPDATMTRAMLAQVLYNFARGAKAGNGTAFADVSAGDWFNAAVGWAYENGVVTGYGGTFGARNNITRQDMATILYRYAKQAGYDVSKTASLDKFSDAGDVADYAAEAMRWAVGMGLIEGSDGKLNPTGNATRAQVAAIMTRFVRNAK